MIGSEVPIGWTSSNPQGVTLSLKWLSKIGSKDYNLLLVELGLLRPSVRETH